MEAALRSPLVTPFTFRCPFPPSPVTLWAARGSFEDTPHYISTKTVRAEGMRISQGYFGPKKKKDVILRILRKAAGSKAPHAAISGEARGVIS